MRLPEPGAYGWITLAAIIFGAWLWYRRWKTTDPTLFGIFVGGITGAFVGAKVIYILAEGWLHFGAEDFWLQIAAGKSILGALLGGYAGVELTKKLIHYQEPTGDWFAFVVPLGIATGRAGCLRYGCCLGAECDAETWYAMLDEAGVARWPAAGVELMFNLGVLLVLFQLRKFPSLKGQLFHVYLIAYGVFRFGHEFLRGTPKVIGGTVSGYQIVALLVLGLGIWRFWTRRSSAASSGHSTD
tara:strand:+ start:201 stop:926 length:726 start_codon:yes stop_codon:yes gene_type:complete